MEKGENEEQTARREAFEETGLKNLVLTPRFRKVNIYEMYRGPQKVERHVVFLLAESKNGEITLSDEHTAYEWLDFADAIHRVKFPALRSILGAAAQKLDPSFKWKNSDNPPKKFQLKNPGEVM